MPLKLAAEADSDDTGPTMIKALPEFRYHPDPVATGSLQASTTVCVCCDRSDGYVYTGPVYAEDEYVDEICPWCIADGTAHAKLDAEFTDLAGVGDYGSWSKVSQEISEEVAFRTPGFAGWQQERWFTCCGDAAAFLGRAGYSDVAAHGMSTIEAVRHDLGWEDAPQWQGYLRSLHREQSPTAYLFQCLRCETVGGYSDFT